MGMQIHIEVEMFGLVQVEEVLLDGIHTGLVLNIRTLVEPIQILAQGVHSVVSLIHPVRVYHRHYHEHEVVHQYLHLIITIKFTQVI